MRRNLFKVRSCIRTLAVPFRTKPWLVTSFRYPDFCVRSSVSSRTPFYCSRRISALRVFLFQVLTTYGNYGTSARGGWRAAMTVPLCLPVALTLWSGTEAVTQRKMSKHGAPQESTLETACGPGRPRGLQRQLDNACSAS